MSCGGFRAGKGAVMVEPWLRGTLTEWNAVTRQVLHALELADEDVSRWCAELTAEEMEMRPFGVAPVRVSSAAHGAEP